MASFVICDLFLFRMNCSSPNSTLTTYDTIMERRGNDRTSLPTAVSKSSRPTLLQPAMLMVGAVKFQLSRIFLIRILMCETRNYCNIIWTHWCHILCICLLPWYALRWCVYQLFGRNFGELLWMRKGHVIVGLVSLCSSRPSVSEMTIDAVEIETW